MTVLYHGTHRFNLPSIAEHGLLPHHPAFWTDGRVEPTAVFLTDSAALAAEHFLERCLSERGLLGALPERCVSDLLGDRGWDLGLELRRQLWTVLRVDTDGLPIEPMTVYDSSYDDDTWFCREPIAPGRLTRLNGRPLRRLA